MIQLESSDYAKDHLLKGLNDLRKQGIFCDVTIMIDNQRFQAHKIVLSASSTYFNSMFTSGFQESRNSEVQIGVGSVEIFKEILEFAYTGRFQISPETLSSFLHVACYMDFKYAIKECVKYTGILGQMTFEDALELYCLAECHKELEPLVDPLMTILVENFVDVGRTDCFMSHASKDFIVTCLNRKEIETDYQNEEELFLVVLDWLFHDWVKRKQHAFDVLKPIRLGLIPIDKVIEGDRMDPLFDIPECEELFLHVFNLWENYDFGSLKQTHPDLFATRYSVILPVYTEIRHATVSLHFRSKGYCYLYEDFARFPGLVSEDLDTLHHFGHGFSLLAVAGEVYVAGGVQDARDRFGIPYPDCQFYKYDPDTNEWCFLPPMPSPDCYPLLVEMDGFIYAIGCSSERYESRNAERYHIGCDIWDESVRSLNLELNDLSGVACNGYLLVAGSCRVKEANAFGEYDQNLYVYVTAYNPKNNTWTKVYQSYIPPGMMTPVAPTRSIRRRCQYPVQIFFYDGSYYFQSVRYNRGNWQVKVEEVIFECTDPENLLFTLGEEVNQKSTFGASLVKEDVVTPSQLISIDTRKMKLSVMRSCVLPHNKKDLFLRAREGW